MHNWKTSCADESTVCFQVYLHQNDGILLEVTGLRTQGSYTQT